MRTVALVIGADTVSNDVVSFTTKRRTLSVGSFSAVLKNEDGQWTGDFAAKDDVTISIADNNDGAATQIFKGYLETATPFYDLSHQQFLMCTGKDYAADLDWLWQEKEYTNVQVDNILDDLLDAGAEPSEVTYDNAAVATTAVNYKAQKGVYYSQHLKALGELINYDGYVNDSKALQFFTVGNQSSGVTISDSIVTPGGILRLRYSEIDSSKLRNYIDVSGRQVLDGWTEHGSLYFDNSSSSCTISDDATDYLVGNESVKIVADATPETMWRLDFTNTAGSGPRSGDYTTLDISDENRKFAWFTYHEQAATWEDIKITLTDDSTNIIFWHGDTGDLSVNEVWNYCEVPVGKDTSITAAATGSRDQWEFAPGDTAFTWIINDIEWEVDPSPVAGKEFWFDGLMLPVDMMVVKQNAASIASYRKRKLFVSRPEIYSQNELDSYASAVLAQRKDPDDYMDVTVIGNTSLDFPGETVVVTSSDEGLSTVTCRIVELSHVYNGVASPVLGHDYVTKLVLDAQTSIVKDSDLYLSSMRQGVGWNNFLSKALGNRQIRFQT
jgi:hypothetical protein